SCAGSPLRGLANQHQSHDAADNAPRNQHKYHEHRPPGLLLPNGSVAPVQDQLQLLGPHSHTLTPLQDHYKADRWLTRAETTKSAPSVLASARTPRSLSRT